MDNVTFREKKMKKFILIVASTDGSSETKEYEGDKDDIQGLLGQFTQCQDLVNFNYIISSSEKPSYIQIRHL